MGVSDTVSRLFRVGGFLSLGSRPLSLRNPPVPTLTPPIAPPRAGNRAFAHIKLENYGAAMADASRAIEIDPKYIKAYYRRADAHFCLLQFKEAVRDFRIAAKVAPNDPDLRRKLAACEKEVKRIRFEAALSSPEDNMNALEVRREGRQD